MCELKLAVATRDFNSAIRFSINAEQPMVNLVMDMSMYEIINP